jgi:hypothetical protein
MLAALSEARAADLCEGCWEVGFRGAYLDPSSSAGLDPTPGGGVTAAFRFRPFWSVEFALARYPGRIPDGPDETLGFFDLSLIYTFHAAREQRTRPYAFFVAGLASDQIQGATSGSTSSRPASDYGLSEGIGAGGLTEIGTRSFLRYEARFINWSSFGISQSALVATVGAVFRLGR